MNSQNKSSTYDTNKIKLGKSKTCMIDVVKKINEHQSIANIISIRNGGRVEPIWFTNFRKENDKRWDQQMEFNKQVMNFMADQNKRWDQQMEFNKQIINRLDEHDKKFDQIFGILKKHTQDIKEIKGVLKRNNIK